jgi:flavorubredoxin
MRALVVYESMFGNTQSVARAVAEGLQGYLTVDALEVSAAPTVVPADVNLLVVGGPTHVFGMTRPNTRADAMKQAHGGSIISTGSGMREWIEQLAGPRRLAVATFDTRVKVRWMGGSAAASAAKRLRRRGFDVTPGKESFYVQGTPGPLADGEVDRAREWGRRLGAQVTGAELTRR